MDDTSLPSILPRLEDELFFAVLDVALDIDQALMVETTNRPVYINGIRDAVRYSILYPAISVNLTYRYADLRNKGLMFLQRHSMIGSMKYDKWGISGWEGRWAITVPDPAGFERMLTELRREENRRLPGRKMETDIHSATARLVQLADSFHRVALRLRSRRTERPPLLIKDEYDVQYVFTALMETQFDDVRYEEWGPSYAGKATRVDFFLKNELVLFETKMTRDGLTDGKLGEELIIDIDHYKQRPDCKALVCFVYDPESRLKNARGLENDLSKQHNGLKVVAIVRPK
jgi:hypothetical protein